MDVNKNQRNIIEAAIFTLKGERIRLILTEIPFSTEGSQFPESLLVIDHEKQVTGTVLSTEEWILDRYILPMDNFQLAF